MWWLFRKPKRDLTALRAYYLLNEADLGDALDEDSFTEWLEGVDESGDADFYNDLGEIQLSRLEADEGEGDLWEWLGSDAQNAWQHYQRANQSWGIVQWVARIHAWAVGLPWF